jgi:PAS domain S-box-containing protein
VVLSEELENIENEDLNKKKELDVIFNSNSIGIMRVLNSKISEVNNKTCQLYGYERDEIVGLSTTDLHVSEQSERIFVSKLQQSVRNGEFPTFSYKMRRKNGEHIWLYGSGNILAMNGTNRDIIWFFYEGDVRLNAQRTVFKIRRILNRNYRIYVDNIFESVERFENVDANQDYVNAIRKCSSNLIDKIIKSFDIHKLENGTYQLRLHEFELKHLFVRIEEDLKELINDKEIVIELNYTDRALHPLKLDYILMYNLFFNLIKNAVEASPRNEKVIVDLYRDRFLNVEITNIGEISEVVKDKFFDKWSSSGKIESDGLGTYLSKLICDAHGANITMNHNSGEVKVNIQFPN